VPLTEVTPERGEPAHRATYGARGEEVRYMDLERREDTGRRFRGTKPAVRVATSEGATVAGRKVAVLIADGGSTLETKAVGLSDAGCTKLERGSLGELGLEEAFFQAGTAPPLALLGAGAFTFVRRRPAEGAKIFFRVHKEHGLLLGDDPGGLMCLV
jgi:hypothetical protein